VVRNTPSLGRFDPVAQPSRPFMADGTLRLIYTGALTPTYELDVAIRAVAAIRAKRPELAISFDVFGRGDTSAALEGLSRDLGLGDVVRFLGRIPLEAVPAAIAAADIGLAPTRRDAFTDASLSTKILEYAAMRRPAVVSRLPMVVRTFPPGTVSTYQPGDAEDLAASVLRLV